MSLKMLLYFVLQKFMMAFYLFWIFNLSNLWKWFFFYKQEKFLSAVCECWSKICYCCTYSGVCVCDNYLPSQGTARGALISWNSCTHTHRRKPKAFDYSRRSPRSVLRVSIVPWNPQSRLRHASAVISNINLKGESRKNKSDYSSCL